MKKKKLRSKLKVPLCLTIRFWEREQQNSKNGASLLKALAKTFTREYTILALLCLINDVILKILQPQFLRKFLLYFKWVVFHR